MLQAVELAVAPAHGKDLVQASTQGAEKAEFETIAGFSRDLDEGNAGKRGCGLKAFANFGVSDDLERGTNGSGQLIDRENALLAQGFEPHLN